MAVSNVIKVQLIGFKKDKDSILSYLHKKGIMEIEEITDPELEKPEIQINNLEYDLAGLKFAINFLSQFSDEKTSLKDKILGRKIKIKNEDFQKFIHYYPYREIIFNVQKIELDLNETKNEMEELKKEFQKVYPWSSLKEKKEEFETKTTKTVFGIISEKNYLFFIQKLNKLKLNYVNKVNQIGKKLYIKIIFDKNLEEEHEEIFQSFKFEKVIFPYADFSPKETLELINKKIKEKEKKYLITIKEAKKLSREIYKLKIIYDYLGNQKSYFENLSKLGFTNSSFMLRGWIEEKFLNEICEELKEITPYFHLEKIKIREDEEIPVVLHNSNFYKPFEIVTNIYGLPRANEIDPTPILAPFFTLFFGFALGDAGYGLLLIFLSIIGIKFLKIPKENQKFLKLLLYCGISTFIIGTMLGSWFGLDAEKLPPLLREILVNFKILDQTKNPLLILGIALILGLIQIWSGILVAFYWNIKQKRIKNAIFENALWLYFIPSLLLFAFYKGGIIDDFFSSLINLNFYISIFAIIILSEWSQKNIFLKIIKGIGKLYGLVGYFSDVLSYSRLLALGLATGIIAMVINLIANIVASSLSYIGFILAIFILIGGHIFNLAINVLGAFIHSARLQFVEFFPKFMEGGGRRFKPFSFKTEFVEIINK